MKKLEELVPEEGSVVILGHVRPDGDCVGSCLAAYLYLTKLRPEQEIRLILGPFADSFRMLSGSERIEHDFTGTADICLCLDTSDRERLGDGAALFDRAKTRICIDHHHTNTGFADVNVICGEISSASELLAGMLDAEVVDQAIAESLYLGIVHDTGCFKHSNTKRATMETAGRLLEYGVSSSRIIDDTFYHKALIQNRILGHALLQAELAFSGRCIISCVTWEDLQRFHAAALDLEGVIDQLRVTDGTEVAVLIHENGDGCCKISMRSSKDADVSKVALVFGGGGHVKAAGCTIEGSAPEAKKKLTAVLKEQLFAGEI